MSLTNLIRTVTYAGLTAITVLLWSPVVSATSIGPGFDLFSTPGDGNSIVDLSSFGLGIVPLVGAPGLMNFGGADIVDTIVRRVDPIPLNAGDGPTTIDIEIVALSLTSIDPVDLTPLGGSFTGVLSDLFITIDPGNAFPTLPVPNILNPSIGNMAVDHAGANGGNFNSCFGEFGECGGVFGGGIFADGIFTVVGGDPNNPLDVLLFQPADRIVLASTGTWSHTQPVGDQHNGSYPAGQFYIESIVHTGPHQPVVASAVPVPAAVWLFGSGLIALMGIAKRKNA